MNSLRPQRSHHLSSIIDSLPIFVSSRTRNLGCCAPWIMTYYAWGHQQQTQIPFHHGFVIYPLTKNHVLLTHSFSFFTLDPTSVPAWHGHHHTDPLCAKYKAILAPCIIWLLPSTIWVYHANLTYAQHRISIEPISMETSQKAKVLLQISYCFSLILFQTLKVVSLHFPTIHYVYYGRALTVSPTDIALFVVTL